MTDQVQDNSGFLLEDSTWNISTRSHRPETEIGGSSCAVSPRWERKRDVWFMQLF